MNRLNTRQRVESWLNTFGHLFNKNALEREVNISKGILQKHLKYGRKITNEDIIELRKLMKEFNDFFKRVEHSKKNQ
ncbi:hypothetical protein [Aquimarina algiphila]|uniref:Uncharacterized protein n=1 Tax=Aquimarina algiphila TaxID=2047982 RepID=A0A554VRJ7_9FLAO|nr:hypothetical protein [Aquimarina algiphila]TSE11283.1 hypothetical protein FOF46_01245 [Aquimarina algiphila]